MDVLDKLFKVNVEEKNRIEEELKEKRKNPTADISIKIQQEVERVLKMEEPGWVFNAANFDINKENPDNVYLRIMPSKTKITANALSFLTQVFGTDNIEIDSNISDAGGPYTTIIVKNPAFR